MTELTLGYSLYKGSGKAWLARVTGTDPKYGLHREFVNAVERHASRSGATGQKTFLVADGLYECESRDGREYAQISDGQTKWINREALLELLAS